MKCKSNSCVETGRRFPVCLQDRVLHHFEKKTIHAQSIHSERSETFTFDLGCCVLVEVKLMVTCWVTNLFFFFLFYNPLAGSVLLYSLLA